MKDEYIKKSDVIKILDIMEAKTYKTFESLKIYCKKSLKNAEEDISNYGILGATKLGAEALQDVSNETISCYAERSTINLLRKKINDIPVSYKED